MTNKELKGKLEAFLDEYSSEYPKGATDYIRTNFWKRRKPFEAPDILMQIYSELGVYKEKDNLYIKYLEMIKSIFSLDCNMLEIGGGFIPSFSNIIAKEQLKTGHGTITVYDPVLLPKKLKYSNLKLVKDKFTMDTNISSYDLLVGIFPCDVTETIIKKACIEKKDFYIQMCGCTHFTLDQIMEYGLSVPIYQKYIIDLANSMLNENICIDKLDNKCGIDYPILYKKF